MPLPYKAEQHELELLAAAFPASRAVACQSGGEVQNRVLASSSFEHLEPL
jgi:hypothetical protein